MSKKEKTYNIKIPAYSSELYEKDNGLFDGHSYQDMVDYIDKKLISYKETKPNLTRKKRNKIKEVKIQDIDNFKLEIGEIPVRLLKISAYNTNLIDGFVETEKKVVLTKNDKLGSDTNFMLLYPIITGLNESKYQYQWKILLYEDPTKDNREFVSICKTVLDKVFNIKVRNIKLDSVIKLLKEKEFVSELSMQFNSISNDEDIDTYLKQYNVKSSLKKTKYNNLKNVPFKDVEKLINDKNYEKDYQKRIIKFFFHKKEIKLTNEFIEAKEIIKNTVEEIFNSEIIIKESNINKMFEIDYIMKNFTSVINDYIC